MRNECFISFQENVSAIPLPDKFTFPFNYTPHPLSELAAKELQEKIVAELSEAHPFWEEDEADKSTGKMFGVLVVKDKEGNLGYLASFSGKLGDRNDYPGFVPPVFDMLDENGFFRIEERELTALNQEIERLLNDPEYLRLSEEIRAMEQASVEEIKKLKAANKERKRNRSERRKQLDQEANPALQEELDNESRHDHFMLKDLARQWKTRLSTALLQLDQLKERINTLKKERKERSAALQAKLFEQYQFLNLQGDSRSLQDIFAQTKIGIPPSGAGECAAPKLLQYAFMNNLTPVAMAEFWWGKSPASVIRKHQHFYPACKSKCEPILGHMLEGMEIDANPLDEILSAKKDIEIIFEDDHLLVINKPHGLLSVPGIDVQDSVEERIKASYPDATGPLLVHRLDMSTSGVLLIAKTKETHKHLQQQFIERSVRKQYIALLEGIISEEHGKIELPLRVDLDDRPRQLVCYDHGKPAITSWEVIDRNESRTRIRFTPYTGRTHQLRVHAAHPSGLNAAIVGDELYGHSDERLCLHSYSLEFVHPVTGEKLKIVSDPEF